VSRSEEDWSGVLKALKSVSWDDVKWWRLPLPPFLTQAANLTFVKVIFGSFGSEFASVTLAGALLRLEKLFIDGMNIFLHLPAALRLKELYFSHFCCVSLAKTFTCKWRPCF
jgi:hypothetical protein